MFAPFTRVSDFFPGLFLWVDPTCFGRSLATALGSGGPLTPRDLRPCLVVAVDAAARTFSAAPLSATQPQQHADGWAPIDTPPLLTWKLNNAWLWVGPPPTLAMVFAQPKIMHPNKDVYYSAPPVSTANLAHYWERRAAYEAARTSTGSKHVSPSPSRSPAPQYTRPSPSFPSIYPRPAADPVVVPAGFTEAQRGWPGWWRNPATGWFWHTAHGLVAPGPTAAP